MLHICFLSKVFTVCFLTQFRTTSLSKERKIPGQLLKVFLLSTLTCLLSLFSSCLCKHVNETRSFQNIETENHNQSKFRVGEQSPNTYKTATPKAQGTLQKMKQKVDNSRRIRGVSCKIVSPQSVRSYT